MLGAIIGDIVGSPYEFTHNNIKTKDFPLFSEDSHFTDDTVMTIAVAAAMLDGAGDPDKTRTEVVRVLRAYGNLYPGAGYGQKFSHWLDAKEAQPPYGSYGNGSAMRVSSVAWLFDDLETVELFAEISAAVTHNHPEGIKGAQATAAAIFLARTGQGKAEIKQYIATRYAYDLGRTPEQIRPDYVHVESCQETVPEAIIAFLHSDGFEDALRVAVSLGGDSDTLAAITGSIAEAAYGVPPYIKQKALSFLDQPLLDIYQRFAERLTSSKKLDLQ
jgi:ADP-ribosylglycohydrolase